MPQLCIRGSRRRTHGQHVGSANCRAKLDPRVMLPPPRSEFQPLSISAPSSHLAHSSAAISPLQVIILKGKRGGGEAREGKALTKLFRPLEDVEKPTLPDLTDGSF